MIDAALHESVIGTLRQFVALPNSIAIGGRADILVSGWLG